jgi:hypothetical protein
VVAGRTILSSTNKIVEVKLGSPEEPKERRSGGWRAGYVATTTLILLVATSFWVRNLDTNPLTVAQNKRVMFTGSRDKNDPVYSPLPVNNSDHLSILFIGNSQSYAIMDYSPGDQCMITSLSDMLNGGTETETAQFPVRYSSLANVRMTEVLVKSVNGVTDAQHRPDVVLVGIVLDGLRVLEARSDIAQTAGTSSVPRELTNLAEGSPEFPLAIPAVKTLATGPETQTGAPQSQATTGQKGRLNAAATEDRLQAKLDRAVPLFEKRQDIYAFLVRLYETQRNTFLRIDTSSRRPIAPATYQTNLQLIEMTLKYLREHNVHAVLYFAPIRPVEPNPYDPADISRFRQDFSALCARQSALCLDYSNLVPEGMWTVYQDNEPTGKTGQRDYAHFTARAHQKVAAQLTTDLLPHLRQWLSEKGAPRMSSR